MHPYFVLLLLPFFAFIFLFVALYAAYWLGILIQVIIGDRSVIDDFDCENKQSIIDEIVLGPHAPPPPPWKRYK